MKISVIIPSYSPEEYLFDCLEAIRNQTLNQNEFETLVVLNGCKEPYFEQIQKYIMFILLTSDCFKPMCPEFLMHETSALRLREENILPSLMMISYLLPILMTCWR